MNLKKLTLTNFQKHAKLELNFTPNLNIISGDTDSGKSCIVRAITWLFHGFPQGDVVRKEGSKKTSVKAILDNDIEVERIKSASKNAYVLTVNGERKEFNAIGREIPKEVKEVLGIRNLEIDGEDVILNISKQISLPFLLDKSGSFRMKLFNKLTGNDLIDKAFKSLNRDILQVNRTEKIEQGYLEENQKSLEITKIKLDKLEKIQQEFSKQVKSLKEKSEKYERLSDLSNSIKKIDEEAKDTDEKLKNIKTIPDETLIELDLNILKLEKLNELLYKIKKTKKELLQIEEELKTIKIPEIDANALREKIEKLTRLRKIITNLKDIQDLDDNFILEIEKVSEDISWTVGEYKQLLRKYKICPTCKKGITEEDIKELKL